jgi:hypothetical protein
MVRSRTAQIRRGWNFGFCDHIVPGQFVGSTLEAAGKAGKMPPMQANPDSSFLPAVEGRENAADHDHALFTAHE